MPEANAGADANPPKKIRAYLVAAGDYHDIDHARLELLKLFAEVPNIRVQVAHNFHDIEAIQASDFLVTYTCNVIPTEAEQVALRDYVRGGKRWFALHGTNSILRFIKEGVDCPPEAPVFMETLGSQFASHPPIMPFKVTNADPEHPLVKGIGEFETDDELYLCDIHGKLHHLLETRFSGTTQGFIRADWPTDEPRPVYYLHQVGQGEVVYLNLGHCRGHWDMQPLMDYYPKVELGSWAVPEYYELLRRGLRYCANNGVV